MRIKVLFEPIPNLLPCRFDGNVGGPLPHAALLPHHHRHPQRVRVPRAALLLLHCHRHLSLHQGAEGLFCLFVHADLLQVVLFSPGWNRNDVFISSLFYPPSEQDAGAGLLAAAMIAVVPGYISRSVAGSYDNEGLSKKNKKTLTFNYSTFFFLSGSCCNCIHFIYKYIYKKEALEVFHFPVL